MRKLWMYLAVGTLTLGLSASPTFAKGLDRLDKANRVDRFNKLEKLDRQEAIDKKLGVHVDLPAKAGVKGLQNRRNFSPPC